MTRRALVVFVRAPELGRVKTRLAAELGDAMALRIYQVLGARAVAVAAAVPQCELRVAFTPADRSEMVRRWLGDAGLLTPQCDGDFGCRLATAIRDARADGAEQVVVIGSDCPGITTGMLEMAFAHLDEADVVIGPAIDGGYVLIGVRDPHPALFADIPWSSAHTLAATLRAAKAARLRLALLDATEDIDTADDWRRWSESQSAHSLRPKPASPFGR